MGIRKDVRPIGEREVGADGVRSGVRYRLYRDNLKQQVGRLAFSNGMHVSEFIDQEQVVKRSKDRSLRSSCASCFAAIRTHEQFGGRDEEDPKARMYTRLIQVPASNAFSMYLVDRYRSHCGAAYIQTNAQSKSSKNLAFRRVVAARRNRTIRMVLMTWEVRGGYSRAHSVLVTFALYPQELPAA